MIGRLVVLALVLAACDTPDLTIIYRVADGTTGPTCGTTSCADVPMACQSVLHLRVLRPSDPNAPFISICEDIRTNSTADMCAIGNVDLPRRELPRETLEVQVTVWPREAVLDLETGELDCAKVPVEFDSTRGFPIAAMNPAFGGRAFYHPGDEETVVTLGCVDVPSVNAPSCVGLNTIDVKATVGDFENLPFSVSSTIADRLAISIGEPKPFDDGVRTGHSLNSANTAALARTVVGPTPAWGAGVDLELQSSACIQALEDGAQTTSSLRCKAVSASDNMLDLPGVRLPKTTLDDILGALALVEFPEEGLTVGIVLDNVGAPASGLTVSSTMGSVEYINASRTGVVTGATSASGIFVSRDAPYGTNFSTFSIEQTVNAIGGLVDGKVTVVILQFDTPIGG
ncbi:MAG: hypothetical protein H0V17_34135 [Deltaproteobacteria bacterium]|nr:hypothetical protein [Deltaproteobacteria bacterium]